MPICGRGNYIPIDKGGLGLHVPAAKLKLIYNMRKCGDPVVVEVANHEYWLRERERERSVGASMWFHRPGRRMRSWGAVWRDTSLPTPGKPSFSLR